MVQELDSYECVVISIALQTTLILNEMVAMILTLKRGVEYYTKFIFLIFCGMVLYYNYVEWLSVFFDEIVSLVGGGKLLFVVCFYSGLSFIVLETWKIRKRFKNVKMI